MKERSEHQIKINEVRKQQTNNHRSLSAHSPRSGPSENLKSKMLQNKVN